MNRRDSEGEQEKKKKKATTEDENIKKTAKLKDCKLLLRCCYIRFASALQKKFFYFSSTY